MSGSFFSFHFVTRKKKDTPDIQGMLEIPIKISEDGSDTQPRSDFLRSPTTTALGLYEALERDVCVHSIAAAANSLPTYTNERVKKISMPIL